VEDTTNINQPRRIPAESAFGFRNCELQVRRAGSTCKGIYDKIPRRKTVFVNVVIVLKRFKGGEAFQKRLTIHIISSMVLKGI